MRVSFFARSGLVASLLLFYAASVFASDARTNASHAPTADAGPSRTVVVGEVVTLDAGGSSDLDGDRLDFYWTLSAPRGSGAQLSDPTALRPTFTVDLLGDYVAELVVHDDKLLSASDTVRVSTGNVAPVALVDSVATSRVGEALVLDGSRSYDFNNDPLTYRWSLVEAPADSRAAVDQARSASATFIADVPGQYRVQLTVSDGRNTSEAASVLIDTEATLPIADAGPDRRAYTGTPVRLNSSVTGESLLRHDWRILHAPAQSNAVIEAADAKHLWFSADVPGDYLIQLVTQNDDAVSRPDTVVVTAYAPPLSLSGGNQRGGSDVDGDGVPDDVDNCAEDFNPSQLDTNGDGFGNICDADLDNDGFITNFGDLVIWAAAFNTNPSSPNWNPDADFNGDNAVNFLDLFIFQNEFLTAPGPVVNRFINPLGGTWHDPANWSLGVVPVSIHSARIDIGSVVSVEYSMDTGEIESLRSTTNLEFSGGDLTVNGDMQVDALVTLSGSGTLRSANILDPITPETWTVPASSIFTLANVTLGADVTIEPGGQLYINDDLTFSGGARITLASNNTFTYLRFVGVSGTTSVVDGDGEIVLGGSATVDNRNSIEVFNTLDGLILGPDVTLRSDSAGGRLDHRFNNGPITIQGTVQSNLSGRTIFIEAWPLTIEGSLEASNGATLDANFRDTGGAITASATLSADTAGELFLQGDWVSDGTMSISDATLDISASLTDDWDNNGTVTLSNATLELGGAFTIADIGTMTGTGTTILDGNLDNTGLTLDVGVDFPGTSFVPGQNGIITGGSIVNTPLTIPDSTTFSIENVTLGTDITINPGGQLFVNDDLTLSGGTITLASDNTFTYLRFRSLSGSVSTVSGTGDIVFGGDATIDNRNSIEVFDTTETLVIGPGVTLRSDTAGGRLDHRFNNGPITIQGTVQSNLPGRSIFIEAWPLTIEGNLEVSNDAILDVYFRDPGGVITASAMLSADTGGELQLRGDWINNGTISISDALLDIGDGLTEDWSNNGTIALNNSTLELGGSFTTADVGTVTGTGSTVVLNGSLDNTGMTLDVGLDLPGSTFIPGQSGVIVGGSIVNTAFAVPTFTTFTLDNVTLGADVTVSPGGVLLVNDALTLSGGATITLASDNNFTYLRFVAVSGTTSTLGGTGEIVFGGDTSIDNRNSIEAADSTEGLVIGPNVTIRSDTAGGRLDHRFNNGPITIQGTVQSNLPGRSVFVEAYPLTIEGSLEASNDAILEASFRDSGGVITASATLSADTGGELQLSRNWVNFGTMSATDAVLDLGIVDTDTWDNDGTITISNSTLELGGSFTLADVGNATGTGTTVIDGILDNTGMTLDVSADLPGLTVELGNNGEIIGGSIVNTPLTVPDFTTFILENVTLGADITINPGGQLFIDDDLTLSGGATITLASDNNFTYLRFRAVTTTTSTVSGTGEIVFGGSATVDNRNSVEAYISTDALVIGPDITVRSDTAGGTIDHRINNGPITIQGTVQSNIAGRQVTVDGAPLTIEGTLEATNNTTLDVNFRNAGGSIASGASISADTGSLLQLRGNWTSEGSVSITDATLDIGGTSVTDEWDNNGTITLSNATLELGGAFSLADVGTVPGTGTTSLTGTLDNTGMTLDVGTDLPGTTFLLGNNGTIIGGSIVNTPITLPNFTTFVFDNVTLGADVTVNPGGQLFIDDDLTLSGGATITLASDNNFTYLRFRPVSGTTSTLNGTGEIVFGGIATIDNRNSIEAYDSTEGLIIGAGITVRTDTAGGTLDHRLNNGPITIQGTVISDLPNRSVTLAGSALTIEGTVQTGAGAVTNFNSDYTLAATATLDVDIGGTATNEYGRLTAVGRTANLDGTLNLSVVNGFSPMLSDTFGIMTFGSRNGTFATENGTAIGGGLSFDVQYNATDVTLEVIN